MKEPVNFIGQPNLTKCEMRNMVMKTEEPDSTREATIRVVKIIEIIYAKADLDKVAAVAVHLDNNQHNMLLSILK